MRFFPIGHFEDSVTFSNTQHFLRCLKALYIPLQRKLLELGSSALTCNEKIFNEL